MLSEYDVNTVKRLFGGGAGATLLILSVIFSTNLLQNRFTNNVELGLATGVILGIVVTVLEFIFNSEGGNMTLTIRLIAMTAYGFGVTSNVLGIVQLQSGDWLSWVIGFALGMPLELLPEPLIYWALTGKWPPNDVIGSIFGVMSRQGPQRQDRPQPHERPIPVRYPEGQGNGRPRSDR